MRRAAPAFLTCLATAIALVVFSQLGAVYDGDEGLHEIAIALSRAGRRPYIDFFYWHEPLYLYVAGAWAAIGGASWRSLHLLSAICTSVAVWTIAATTMRHVTDRWRGAAAALAALLFAGNVLVIKWGTITHNYGLALMAVALAVACALRAVETSSAQSWIGCGFFAGVAAATTPLNVLIVPLVAMWLFGSARTQPRRWLWFVAAAAVPFVPLIRLGAISPFHPWFGLVTHHVYLRTSGAFRDELNVPSLVEIVTSPQVLVLTALIVLALATNRRAEVDDRERRLVSLTSLLALATAAFTAFVRPPAQAQYYTVVAPAAACAAAVGAIRVARMARAIAMSRAVAAAIAIVFLLPVPLAMYRQRLWVNARRQIDQLAAEVNRVTPPGGAIYSSQWFVYAAAGRLPAPGFENESVSRIDYPPDVRARLPLAPASDIKRRVLSGEFDTVLTTNEDPRFDPAELDRRYVNRRDLDAHWVLRWTVRR